VESGQLVVEMESAKTAVLGKTPPKRWINPPKRRKKPQRNGYYLRKYYI
jgi:hypothetical protein